MKAIRESDNSYYVGETIILTAQVYRGDTKVAVDPDAVELLSFTKDGATIGLASSTFVRISEGTYELDITSAHLDAGVYEYRIKVHGGLGVSGIVDTLVIREFSPPLTEPEK